MAKKSVRKKLSQTSPFLIAGVGASAGGLPAFTEILSQLPKNSGLALVYVQHMDPSYVSQLPALLSRVSRMPVIEAKNGLPVERNHVYVVPAGAEIRINGGVLRLSKRSKRENPPYYLPINLFLESLARDRKEEAAAVILSGTGSDGAKGASAVHSQGGIVLVQDEDSAQYPDMPKAARSATQVDAVLSGKALAKELLHLASLPAAERARAKKASDPFSGNEDQLSFILSRVKETTGTDFSRYKPTTVQRRILRRMVANKIVSLADYSALLKKNKSEVEALRREILINVTGFFRDAEAFDVLKEKVFPELTKGRSPEEPLRCWVPACSSGEEVYSMAIGLLEFQAEHGRKFPIQIFGSDLSESVLKKARAGLYTENEVAGVSRERLQKYFVKTDGAYQIGPKIRELCIFTKQDLTADPPFSKVDLISCRNLLIYLNGNLQGRVFSIFHYALKPNGILMLGTAETVGNFSDLFAIVDKKVKIYSRKSAPHKLPFDLIGSSRWKGPETGKMEPPYLWDKFDLEKESNRLLIDKFAPPGVVINEDMTILRFQGRMQPYLDPTAGGASLNLLKLLIEGLVTDVRLLIDEAAKKNREAKKEGIAVLRDGIVTHVSVEVAPMPHYDKKERYFVVLFQEQKAKSPEKKGDLRERAPLGKAVPASRLQKELLDTRRRLQDIIEAEETANQELRAANEEIVSSNEELQSTNEELETTKEELQSTNEELLTLNDELKSRNQQLLQSNSDLTNLFVSANLPVIMLQNDLKIRLFTPLAERVMNLIPGDAGRSINDLKPNIDVPDLEDLIRRCMKSGQLQEREVKDRNDRWHLLRIHPYRTAEGAVDGAVLNLIDIDPLKTAMERLADANEYSEMIIKTILNPILVLDDSLRVMRANEAFYHFFQVRPEGTLYRSLYELGNGRWKFPKLEALLDVKSSEKIEFQNLKIECELVSGRKTLLLNACDARTKQHGQVVLLSMQDVTKVV